MIGRRAPSIVRGAALLAGLALSSTAACSFPSARGGAAVAGPVDPASYCEAKAELESLSAGLSKRRKQNVALELSAPYMPSKLVARGATALSPPGDPRMILLGPGGSTAMDLWLHGVGDERVFRFSIPALERTTRGDATTPAEKKRGLPVDFLRWWLLDPFGGELLFASRDSEGLHFVVREVTRAGSTYVDATIAPGGAVTAERTTWSSAGKLVDRETISADKIGCGRVQYEQDSTDLSVIATCEGESENVPDRAFVDPDGAP